MRLVILLNAKAGRTPGDGRAAAVVEAFREHGAEAEVRTVAGPELADAARAASSSRPPPDAVVAAGGDGTVSAVAGALAGTDVPLGVLPLGTLNHFAKDLGLPLDLHEAAGIVAAGNLRRVDLASVNGRPFINNASIGIYPHVVRHRDAQRQRLGRGKWLAMLFAVANALRRFPVVRVRLGIGEAGPSADPGGGQDAPRTVLRTTPFVFVGNNEYEMSLLTVRDRKRLDCGMLSLYVANRTGRFGMLRLALRALFGRLEQARDFDAALLPELWVETGKRHVHVALDGEVDTLTPPLHFRSLPGALRVLAPPAT